MQITIDEKAIAKIVQESIDNALADSFSSYSVKQAFAEVISQEVVDEAIAKAIRQAVSCLNTEQLAQHLAEEIQRATTAAVAHLLQEGLLETICKIRGIGNFSDEDERKRKELKSKLFGTWRV